MFTGLIETTGQVEKISRKKGIFRLIVSSKHSLNSVKKGDSISINGVCLTLVNVNKKHLEFDIMESTYKNTSFIKIKVNDVVNVERALRWESRLDGHFVLGHVDGIQKIMCLKRDEHPYMEISISPDEKKYVIEKGSITIDGISLTLSAIYENIVRIHLIPHTLKNTNLSSKRKSDYVNVEYDILGKYIQENKSKKNKPFHITEKFLESKGFI